MILFGDLLGAQMFLNRHRKIRPAFDGGVVGNDEHFAIADASDASDDARAWTLVVVEVSRGERGEFEEWRIGVEQAFNPLTDEEFALLFLSLAVFFAAALTDFDEALFELMRESTMMFSVLFEFGGG